MADPLRLIFMGTPDFSVPILEALMKAGHQIVCVYSQPPRPKGRGKKETPSPVHAFAAANALNVRTPVDFKDPADVSAFAQLNADAAVVAAYGLLLPADVLAAPRLGCLNVHASLLPRWRGAAPIQRAILAGDRESGITIMQMDQGLDTGDILLALPVAISDDDTSQSLHDRLCGCGASLMVEALEKLAIGDITPTPQTNAAATYAQKLSREDGRLDWSRPAADLERQIRALTPWPGAWFELEIAGKTERLKVLAAQATEASSSGPGTLLDHAFTVSCGAGALRLVSVQRPGKGATSGDAFLRGCALPVGTVLGSNNPAQ